MSTKRASLAALFLLSIARLTASSTPVVWGSDFSEWAPFVARIGVDQNGLVYGLTNCQGNIAPARACVAKVSAGGNTLVWQNQLDFGVAYGNAMTVDPLGNVYVVPIYSPDHPAAAVAKLSPGGSGLAWTATVTSAAYISNPALAADAQGRVYIAGLIGPSYQTSVVIRLTPSGIIDYSASIPGAVVALAVDVTGSAYAIGNGPTPFLARLAPDGSAGFTVALPALANFGALSIAADPAGNTAVLGSTQGRPGLLVRLDSMGNITATSNVTASTGNVNLAMDTTGTAYVAGTSYNYSRGLTWLTPTKNSLLACGSEWISMFASDGTPLQTTWAPPSARQGTAVAPLIAAGPNSTVYVAGSAAADFSPAQAGPFPTSAGQYLWRLSPNASPTVIRLACLGNAATYLTTPIAPDGFVTLFGSGLGPQQGVETQAQAAGVQVTFDGLLSPLLWVQDSQINVLAPWSLTPGATTRVCASYNGPTNCLTWPVAQTDPAVFTRDGIHASAFNQDGTSNSASNPAAIGEVVTVLATGLGPISPAQPDGSIITNLSAVNVLPAGVSYVVLAGGPPIPIAYPCEVTYAGPAPQLVAGASQINFRVPPVTGEAALVVTLPASVSPEFRIHTAPHD